MDNNSKLRMLYIAKILCERTDENHFLTTSQINSILENEYGITSHRQTIKAEIDLLVSFGIDIQETRSTQNKYNFLGRNFDVSEIKLLIDAVESSKFISKENSKKLVEKLCALAGMHEASVLKRNVSCEGRIKTDNKKIYLIIDTINEAINTNKKISFQYFKYASDKSRVLKNEGKEYVITPLHLVWNGDYYYMIGVYDYKQRLGSFRIDRIANCPKILEDQEAALPPDDFDVNDHINSSFRMFNSKRTEVVLECDNDTMDSMVDRFGETLDAIQLSEDTFEIKINIAANHVFFSWVFGFGGKVKIKSPKDVVSSYENMLKDELERILKG